MVQHTVNTVMLRMLFPQFPENGFSNAKTGGKFLESLRFFFFLFFLLEVAHEPGQLPQAVADEGVLARAVVPYCVPPRPYTLRGGLCRPQLSIGS